MHTGQWLRSDTGTRWFFDSGALALDFAYLGGFRAGSRLGPESGLAQPADGSSPWDGLLLPADLDDWLAERFPGLTGGASDRELADARGLRDATARLAFAAVDGASPDPDDVDTLNLFAATPDVPPALAGGRRQAGAGRLRLGQALASVARDGVRLFDETGFGGGDDSRLRRCANPLCGLVYRDESRARSRRWCSMQRCGNRAKVRAHRARLAGGSGTGSGTADA
jgi:predicted RNA-binding Zn ribbon-like protein